MKDPVLRQALIYYVKVTSWIVCPVVALLILKNLLGLDETRGGFIIAIIAAFLISIYGILREIKSYKKTLK